MTIHFLAFARLLAAPAAGPPPAQCRLHLQARAAPRLRSLQGLGRPAAHAPARGLAARPASAQVLWARYARPAAASACDWQEHAGWVLRLPP